MDLDLAQVRAFVAVVDHGHFGRAAESLTLTQQALSKRVARLEQRVGRLLERRRGGVVPTAGGRAVPAGARELLALADHAVLALRESPAPPLRVDVWSEIQMPAALIREVGRAQPDLRLELSTRRDLGDAVRALQRRELDLAFGNVAGLGRPLPRGLTAEPIADEPIAVLVNARGPFGRHVRVRPEDLAPHGLWWPMSGSSAELRTVVEGYAAAIGAPLIDAGSNLGARGAGRPRRGRPRHGLPGGRELAASGARGRAPRGARARAALHVVGGLAYRRSTPRAAPRAARPDAAARARR